jgi:hypothetical protein
MKWILCALLMLAAAPAFGQTNCSQYGGTAYCSDGTTYTQYGNTAYDNQGNNWSQYGNTTYGNQGDTYSRYGNTTYDNQGNSWSTYGNTTYGTNGLDVFDVRQHALLPVGHVPSRKVYQLLFADKDRGRGGVKAVSYGETVALTAP